jgi:Plasmid pRiA4b ORF-3-like protein
MATPRNPGEQVAVKLTLAQRKAVATVVPKLADRLKLDEPHARMIPFTAAELKTLKDKTAKAVRQAGTGVEGKALRHVLDTTTQAISRSTDQVYQLKITLRYTQPPVWRRIQVKDCTLADLHDYIQGAMGWEDEHTHHFRVGKTYYLYPEMIDDPFGEEQEGDSTRTRLGEILASHRKGYRFEYEYDFGDSWWHDVVFEGRFPAEPGQRYPVCLAGERACPPEDIGGVWGYDAYLEALTAPGNEPQEELLEIFGDSYDPNAFDPAEATKAMRGGR